MWVKSEDGKHFDEVAWKNTTTWDAYRRTLQSYYRKSQYDDYGGRLWQYCLLALGDLPPRQDLLTIRQMNMMQLPDEFPKE